MRTNRPKSLIERATRFFAHPLVRYDPEAVNRGIQVLKLEYFEAKTTQAPVPRNQDVPREAFGKLTARSIFVASSHAWFHQCHPDPEGVKLDIMRKDFFPRLRKKYPHTMKFDWLECKDRANSTWLGGFAWDNC